MLEHDKIVVFHDEIMEVCEDIDAHSKVWATSTSPITKHICMKKTQKNCR